MSAIVRSSAVLTVTPRSLVFPIEGTRKTQTTVDYGDLERLKDGEFLNDNLISFYLRYVLRHQTFISP